MQQVTQVELGFLALAVLCWLVFFAALGVLVVTLARRARRARADARARGDGDDSAGTTS